MNILFKVNSSKLIGYGHVERCKKIIKKFIHYDYRVYVFFNEMLENHQLELKNLGCVLKPSIYKNFEIENDLNETIAFIKSIGEIEWLFIDNYKIDFEWENKIKNYVNKIFVIDDLCDKKHYCNAYLNQNFIKFQKKNLQNLFLRSTKLFLGPKYVLLDEKLSNEKPKDKTQRQKIGKVFICFGGSDTRNFTLVTLNAIKPLLIKLNQVIVVSTKYNPDNKELERISSLNEKVEFHISPPNIYKLLKMCDLSIGAGGIMNYERAYFGIPSIIFGITNNQVESVENLIKNGYAFGYHRMFSPNLYKIRNHINLMISQPSILNNSSLKLKSLVDGKGLNRLFSYIAIKSTKGFS